MPPRFPRQHLRSQLPCPFGARAQAGQRPRPSPAQPFTWPPPGVPQPRASRPPQAPGRHGGAGGGSRPLSRVRGPSRGTGRLGLSWRKEWEEGAERTGGSASGRPISMRPRSAHHGNRSPSAEPARQPRAQRAPLLPQVAARAGRARSHGYARAGTHTRGAWGRAEGARCAGPPGPRSYRLWACPQVLQSEPRGGVYLRMFFLCLGVSLSVPVVPPSLVVLEAICLSVLTCLLTPDCMWL